jgi:hypothetical protein
MLFVIKTTLLKLLMKDKRVEKRVNKAKTWREASTIIAEEARKRNIKVVEA